MGLLLALLVGLLYLYLAGKLRATSEAFQFLVLTSLLATIALAILELPEKTMSTVSLPITINKSLLALVPLLAFSSMMCELSALGHLSIASALAVFLALSVATLSKGKALTRTMLLVATVGLLVAALYGAYAPSFGNDTWRDVTVAQQILNHGTFRGMESRLHIAYTLPLVSLLYAVLSTVEGVDVVWASNIIGLLYLFSIVVAAYLLSRGLVRGESDDDSRSQSMVLIISTMIISVWCVWFIPQAYSVLLMVLALHVLLRERGRSTLSVLVTTALLATAFVIGHGGVAVFFVALLLVLCLADMFWGGELLHRNRRLAGALLAFCVVLFVAYFLSSPIKLFFEGVFRGVLQDIQSLVSRRGASESVGKIATVASPLPPLLSILSNVPLAIISVLSAVVFFEDRAKRWMRLLVFLLVAALALALAAKLAFPSFSGYGRYVIFPAALMLIVLSSKALHSLKRRGALGAVYGLALILLAIASFSFGGSLMPENPYTANPYSAYAICGLPTYDEARQLKQLSAMLYNVNVSIDWRGGAYLGYLYVAHGEDLLEGGTTSNSKVRIAFLYAGSVEQLREELSFHVLVLRRQAFSMPDAFSPSVLEKMGELMEASSVVYSGGKVAVLTR
jgi:hypothetical protein